MTDEEKCEALCKQWSEVADAQGATVVLVGAASLAMLAATLDCMGLVEPCLGASKFLAELAETLKGRQ